MMTPNCKVPSQVSFGVADVVDGADLIEEMARSRKNIFMFSPPTDLSGGRR